MSLFKDQNFQQLFGGGGAHFDAQQNMWNPAAIFTNGYGGQRRPPSGVREMPRQPPVAPGGDISNPNPEYYPTSPQPPGRPSFGGLLGDLIIPNTMQTVRDYRANGGKGGGVP